MREWLLRLPDDAFDGSYGLVSDAPYANAAAFLAEVDARATAPDVVACVAERGLTEDEALAVLAFTGACPGVFGALNHALRTANALLTAAADDAPATPGAWR